MALPDLGLGLQGTHVLITGSSGFIGSVTTLHLLSAGCNVTAVDLKPPPASLVTEASSTPSSPGSYDSSSSSRLLLLTADITSEEQLTSAFERARERFGVVQTCIALASIDFSFLPHHESLVDMPLEQWQRTMRVNVEGTFLTARTWLRQIKEEYATTTTREDNDTRKNVGLIITGSESGLFGERGNADYSAGKSAVQVGLVKTLMADVTRIHPNARVNAIAPGPVDTEQFRKEIKENPDQLWLDAQATTALKQPVPPESVAKAFLFLASQAWSGHITGQILQVDSGKTGKIMWPDRS